MKKNIILFTLFVFASIGFAQEVERTLESFNGVKISSAFNVDLKENPISSIKIEGVPEQYIKNIITEVKGDVLHVYVQGKVKASSGMKLTIFYQSINSIDVSGASTIKSSNTINASSFTIKSAGASSIELDLNTQELDLSSTGASSIKLSGVTKKFDLSSTGASSIHAKSFKANNVTLDATGASDIDVYAEDEINGSASGASDVNVFGSPKVSNIQKSGAADVRTQEGVVNISVNNRESEDVNVTIGNTGVRVSDDEIVNINTENKKVSVINDTTRVKWGNTQVLIIDDNVSIHRAPKKRRNHWAGIDLGINGFVNSSGSFDLSNDPSLALTDPKKVTQFMELDYAKSWKVGINFWEHFFKIKQHHFGFVTGLGLEYNNYELRNNVKLISDGGAYVNDSLTPFNEQYTWGIIDTSLQYSKNRFKTFYITAPFLFEINTGQHKNKSFHISTGAILGYKFKTKMKYKYEDDGDTQKYKDNQNFNTNPFKVDLTARVGYGWFTAFATYSLTPLFEKNRGPELHAFSVGMALIGF